MSAPGESRDSKGRSFETSGETAAEPAPGAPDGAVWGNMPSRGDRIGPYTLLELIGEGGFGMVWLAERREPMVQRVAIKIIKPGMDSRAVVARFEQERQALAVMDHPNVAKVFDGGATDRGFPYFVMEYVAGAPITSFCDAHRLTIRQRLELFASVCDAVQHAHMKGIIHRDLKPSNVLAELVDGTPLVKVIDFGIAKALVHDVERTRVTSEGVAIGTPEYMSPEQAGGRRDIDTRSDVYSLGVALYELLVGRTPFTELEVRAAGPRDFHRLLDQRTPPAPSALVRSRADWVGIAATKRATTPASLERCLRDELEWIPLKAIRKERERRYESASALGADIRRYLAGAPLIAAPESRLYRARKLLARNRPVVGAATLVAMSLVAGLAGTIWKAREAGLERDEARAQRGRADERALAAVAAETRALSAQAAERRRADELKQVAEFQARMLARLDAEQAGGLIMREIARRWNEARGAPRLNAVQEQFLKATEWAQFQRLNATDLASAVLGDLVLAPARDAIAGEFEKSPEVAASLRQTVAEVYRALGLFGQAADLQVQTVEVRRALLGPLHPDTLDAINRLGVIRHAQGRYADAALLYREAIDGRRSTLGPMHRDTLASLGNVAVTLQELGEFDEAEKISREVLDSSDRVLGHENPDTLIALNNLASLLFDRGKTEEAEAMFRSALEITRRLRGNEHPETLTSINNLAMALRQQGRLAESEPLFRELMPASARRLGEDHPETIRACANLAILMRELGRNAEAETLFLETLRRRRRALGDNHADTITTVSNFGVFLAGMGRADEAEPYYLEALRKRRAILGDRHRDTLTSLNNLGALYVRMNRLDDAEAPMREAYEGRRALWGDHHLETLQSATNLARILIARDKAAEGVELLEAVLVPARETLGTDDPARLGNMLLVLGSARIGLGETPDTLRLAEERLTEAYRLFDRSRVETTECRRALVKLYTKWHGVEPGAGHDRQAARWSVAEPSDRDR